MLLVCSVWTLSVSCGTIRRINHDFFGDCLFLFSQSSDESKGSQDD